ncbi:Sulfate transporter CysZ [invertebrate metagenome]|uniref:Sulfate transporter CysZ n=1 Tax=invertebrate metagenome TaxID=1711999 RepID=A0A2H9TCH7_9ZZZZ
MILKPTLRWYVLIPLVINLIVFSGMLYGAYHQMNIWITQLISWLPGWLGFLEFLLWPFFTFVIIGMVFFTFTIIGNFIAAPFNALLAEKVQTLEGASLPNQGLKDLLFIIPASIGRECRKILYYLPRALILLLISFIPFINLAAPILWFIFNGWMMAIQYCDYAADNRKISFTDMLTDLKRNTTQVWLLGIIISLAMLIPLLNLLIIPVGVVSASLFWERNIAQIQGL